MYPHRERFAKDIVAEWYEPYFGTKQKEAKGVMIICPGSPGLPGTGSLDRALAKKGYLTIRPSYRGTWESDGQFLKESPEKDIKDILDQLTSSWRLTSLWSGVEYSYKPMPITLIGVSFGGPAALLLSGDQRVQKVITVAAVVDWTDESAEEPMDELSKRQKLVFGNGYRYDEKDWQRLARGEMYQPVTEEKNIDGKKILMIHAADDHVVLIGPARYFAQRIGVSWVELKTGGHISSSVITKWRMWRRVQRFLCMT